MKILRKTIRAIAWLLIGFGLFISLYLIAVFALSNVTVNQNAVEGKDVTIYIATNGEHTDIIVPVKNVQMDWSREIKFSNTISKDTTALLLAIGWGDRDFYINTPSWDALTFRVVFRGAFGLDASTLHATFYHSVMESKDCRPIHLSRLQYAKLITYIAQSFKKDNSGHFINIKTPNVYGNSDAFYEANRHYHIFYTCNTWVNNALKTCDQKACLWTPFNEKLFDLYR